MWRIFDQTFTHQEFFLQLSHRFSVELFGWCGGIKWNETFPLSLINRFSVTLLASHFEHILGKRPSEHPWFMLLAHTNRAIRCKAHKQDNLKKKGNLRQEKIGVHMAKHKCCVERGVLLTSLYRLFKIRCNYPNISSFRFCSMSNPYGRQ